MAPYLLKLWRASNCSQQIHFSQMSQRPAERYSHGHGVAGRQARTNAPEGELGHAMHYVAYRGLREYDVAVAIVGVVCSIHITGADHEADSPLPSCRQFSSYHAIPLAVLMQRVCAPHAVTTFARCPFGEVKMIGGPFLSAYQRIAPAIEDVFYDG